MKRDQPATNMNDYAFLSTAGSYSGGQACFPKAANTKHDGRHPVPAALPARK
jgi:hypothetical protein